MVLRSMAARSQAPGGVLVGSGRFLLPPFLLLTEVAFEPVHGLLNAVFGGGVAGAVVDEAGVFVGG